MSTTSSALLVVNERDCEILKRMFEAPLFVISWSTSSVLVNEIFFSRCLVNTFMYRMLTCRLSNQASSR